MIKPLTADSIKKPNKPFALFHDEGNDGDDDGDPYHLITSDEGLLSTILNNSNVINADATSIERGLTKFGKAARGGFVYYRPIEEDDWNIVLAVHTKRGVQHHQLAMFIDEDNMVSVCLEAMDDKQFDCIASLTNFLRQHRVSCLGLKLTVPIAI
jgi:hypothetical protein